MIRNRDNFDNLIKEEWTKDDYKDFCGQLVSFVEDGYREFAKRGTPTERPFLGVRIPKQRAMARSIIKGNYQSFLKNVPITFEEVNIRGFIIGALPYDEMKAQFSSFLSLVDNWATCDCFCASLKTVKKNRADFLDIIDVELKTLEEFRVRAALVVLLDHYVSLDAPEYLNVIFDRINEFAGFLSDGPGELGIHHDEEKNGKLLAWDAYYVKMAIAWLLTQCYTKFPEETHQYLIHSKLPKWTFNKTISKICDSYRVDRNEKEELKKLRRAD